MHSVVEDWLAVSELQRRQRPPHVAARAGAPVPHLGDRCEECPGRVAALDVSGLPPVAAVRQVERAYKAVPADRFLLREMVE